MLRQILTLIMVIIPSLSIAQLYEINIASVSFNSSAPKELIHASTDKLKGYIDPQKKIFAFKLDIASFNGFNSPLQREHFNENYMESILYPQAVYVGKIIEDVDLTKDGVYKVRAKGKLTIHGVEQERIINSLVETQGGKMVITSDFIVPLADHNIKIPRIVYEKLASDINVTVKATLVPKDVKR
ncbi:YceI family protein [Polluticoccus soli]|uniref:YceI family protein n=1 Tax=Polluticoccus soli TaxID=3034150 RepID=UPI0023E2C641|nr:YceI family protein [Flavipsychrobacter sp. JY13-12]